MWRKKRFLDGIKLNRRQRRAIKCPMKIHCIVAGAGTGKTRVLTLRIVYLIKKFGLLASNILAITFTKKAAQEIAKRIEQYISVTNLKWVRTIHSFCRAFLCEEIRHIGRNPHFNVVADGDREHIIKELCYENNIDQELIERDQLTNAIWNQKIINWSLDPSLKRVDEISSQNQDVDVLNQLIQNVSNLYIQHLVENDRLDFDDLLILTYKILKEFPDVRTKWQDFFDYILVDEFQDIDEIQYQIITMLAQKKQRLFVVGDSDQSIYAWRGAVANIEQRLKNDFPKTKIFLLKQNYRSTKHILKVANKVIKHNPNRIKKRLFTKRKDTSPVICHCLENQTQEAEWIANKIGELVTDLKVFNFKDIAIIYRKKFWTEKISEELRAREFPISKKQANEISDNKEISDMFYYIKAVVTKDDSSLLQILNQPSRGIEIESKKLIRKFADKHAISIYDALVRNSEITGLTFQAHKGIDGLLKSLKTIESESELKFGKIVETITKVLNYEQTITNNVKWHPNKIAEFSKKITDFKEKNPARTLADFIKSIPSKEDAENDNFIKLLTVHSAKGLEFPCVFVAGLVEGTFPDWRSLEPLKTSYNGGIEEERRLFYVAITRAVDELYLTSCKGTSSINANKKLYPSSFIREVPSKWAIKDQLTLVKTASPTNEDSEISRSRKDYQKNELLKFNAKKKEEKLPLKIWSVIVVLIIVGLLLYYVWH